MIRAQGGVCAACKTDEPKHVDHDHETGHVRGMLCFLCNQALGNVRDDVDRLHGSIAYLQRTFSAAQETMTIVEEPGCVFEIGVDYPHAA